MTARRAIQVQRFPQGPRCWVLDQRVHHGATGCALAILALVTHRPRLAVAAVALAAHDRHDWRVWFARERFCANVLDTETATR